MSDATGVFKLDFSQIESLSERFASIGGNAEKVIETSIYGKGADILMQGITDFVPVSGRKFKGHTTGARAILPGAFSRDFEDLSVTIAARGRIGYLYFPDTGGFKTNPKSQDFMQKGIEAKQQEVIDLITANLVAAINGEA